MKLDELMAGLDEFLNAPPSKRKKVKSPSQNMKWNFSKVEINFSEEPENDSDEDESDSDDSTDSDLTDVPDESDSE